VGWIHFKGSAPAYNVVTGFKLNVYLPLIEKN